MLKKTLIGLVVATVLSAIASVVYRHVAEG